MFRYEAFNEGEFDGKITWMVRRWDHENYVECLFSDVTKDSEEAIKIAIKNNSWA